MTRRFLILALAACGGGGNGSNSDGGGTDAPSSGLACSAVTYCSTWSSSSAKVTAPTERGGTIPDGIYRVERGTFAIELLQFAGDKVNEIGDSFSNQSGTYTTANGMISFTYAKRCDKMGITDDNSTWKDRPYFVSGDTLLIGMADSSSGVVWYEYKKIQVSGICTANANVKCDVTNCSCAVVTDGFGTATSGVKSCSSS